MTRTTESKTESKLGTGLEHKTLKFTDYAIFKFQSVFKVNGKTKARIKTPFGISKNIKLKSLKLCQDEATKKNMPFSNSGSMVSQIIGQLENLD